MIRMRVYISHGGLNLSRRILAVLGPARRGAIKRRGLNGPVGGFAAFAVAPNLFENPQRTSASKDWVRLRPGAYAPRPRRPDRREDTP